MNKNIVLGLLVFTLFGGFLSGCVTEKKATSEVTKSPSSRTVAQAQSGDYCIALRGNGELQPAHWGALAKTVEQYGMPSAMAGGSSASISMFLMESIALNPATENLSQAERNISQALMLKSLVGFFGELKQTPMRRDVEKLFGAYGDLSRSPKLTSLVNHINKSQFEAALKVYNEAVELAIIDPETTDDLLRALREKDVARSRFLISELVATARVFGKFDAETDDNVFFRAGIVNFPKAANLFGKIAGFYSSESSSRLAGEWRQFFNTCSAGSENKLWPEIVTAKPQCAADLKRMFTSYFNSSSSNVKPEDRIIGRKMEIYPTTSVLVATGITDFKRARAQYRDQMSSSFGKNFRLSDPESLRFGYWGRNDRLKQIQANLDREDEKARRFVALGPATWKQVLSLSPAEPGLSPLKEFKNFSGESYVSAGGWSDLQPVDVLKAAGCADVVYVTRKGGESLFAQGIAKRLLGFDRGWQQLRPTPESIKLNNEGDPEDMTSIWAKLFNLANPQSSFNRALGSASSVLCTDWNAYNVQRQFFPLIENSYRSSFVDQDSQASIPGCTVRQ